MCSEETAVDFIETIKSNYKKLRNKDIVNILWREILKEERCDSYLDQLIEYSFHYPVDTEAYVEELNIKFDELNKENLRSIDGHLKAYLITFLYYCTKCDDHRVSIKTTVMASSLYIKLITLPGIGKIFFERNMYKVQLVTCTHIVKDNTVPNGSKIYMMKLLKKHCLQEQLEPFLLKATATTFCTVMMIFCSEIIDDIRNVAPLPMYCINSLREIILNEDNGAQLKCILESLFKCLRKCVIGNVPSREGAVNIILVFIRDVLQHELDEDKFQYLLDAFCATWGQEDFDDYEYAIKIMNLLKVQYYKELIRKMVVYTQSKTYKRYFINIVHLLHEIVKNLPPFPLNKIEVLYFCAIRNVLYNFVNKHRNISDAAIKLVMHLCKQKDNQLLNNMFNQFQCTGKFVNISVEALFLCFIRIVDEKWCASPRNQNLLVIFSKFLSHTRNVNIELIQNTLKAICKDASPNSLKPSLPILHELFCIMSLKQEVLVAEVVLKIIFNNAMHQDATSAEYVDHIFQSMLKPSVIDGITYSQKYYCNTFLTSQFEYESLFAKCQKKIRDREVSSAIKNLDYRESGSSVLLCCLLDYYAYTEIKALATYIIDNFAELSGYISAGFICAAFEKILKNRVTTDEDHPQLDLIQSLIITALFQQGFPVPSIKPVFDLFQTIRKVLRLPRDEERLNHLLAEASERAFRRLHGREPGDNSVFMYLNEVCLLLRKLPADNILQLLESYMNDPMRISVLTTYMPDIYIQLLTLFTTLAMINKRKVPLALKYLHENLDNEEKIVRVIAFKLLFSLCQEITHEFGEVIKFALKEMVVADPCFVRICAGVLEQLIHDDYIKLCSEDFFKFIYILGCDDLKIFMRDVLAKRFLLSNQNDVTKFYIQTITYINMCTKLPNYPISTQFYEDLVRIKLKIDKPKEILVFLFEKLPIRKKFNILSEIASIIDDLLRGQCKVDNTFFNALLHFLATFKFMKTTSSEENPDRHYYHDICKQIEKQIVGYDPMHKKQSYYMEYESEIKHCTLALLKLLFFENEQLAIRIQIPLFDTIIHWIDFVKLEIINYIHVERGKDYDPYFSKLVQYYKRNKSRFDIPDSQLSGLGFQQKSKFNVVLLIPSSLYKQYVPGLHEFFIFQDLQEDIMSKNTVLKVPS